MIATVALGLLAVACSSDPPADATDVDGPTSIITTTTTTTTADLDDDPDDDGPDGDGGPTTTTTEVDDTFADTPLAAVASTELVSALASGDLDRAATFLVDEPFDDPAAGAPYDRDLLLARLADVAAAARTGSVRSAEAPLGGGEDIGGGCARDGGITCSVDIAPRTDATTTILVHWNEGGVSDLTIIPLDLRGRPAGIGGSRCSIGFTLVHGGQNPAQYDIAVCASAAGRAEYVGSVRNTDLDIRLDACVDGDRTWVADNRGTRYTVDGTVGPARSTIEVSTSQGIVVEAGPFTSVHLTDAPDAPPCP